MQLNPTDKNLLKAMPAFLESLDEPLADAVWGATRVQEKRIEKARQAIKDSAEHLNTLIVNVMILEAMDSEIRRLTV